jgi:hypothetical protein
MGLSASNALSPRKELSVPHGYALIVAIDKVSHRLETMDKEMERIILRASIYNEVPSTAALVKQLEDWKTDLDQVLLELSEFYKNV